MDAPQVALQRHLVDHHEGAAGAQHAHDAAVGAGVPQVGRREDEQEPLVGVKVGGIAKSCTASPATTW